MDQELGSSRTNDGVPKPLQPNLERDALTSVSIQRHGEDAVDGLAEAGVSGRSTRGDPPAACAVSLPRPTH
jgi:hypothetical protein